MIKIFKVKLLKITKKIKLSLPYSYQYSTNPHHHCYNDKPSYQTPVHLIKPPPLPPLPFKPDTSPSWSSASFETYQ